MIRGIGQGLVAEAQRVSALSSSAATAGLPASDEEETVVVRAVEEALSTVFAATAWEEVALPSFEGRLLRLAALVDAALLQALLQEELFAPCLLLVRGSPREGPLRRRCDAALAAVAPPEVQRRRSG
eukprot:TRINITY_DN34803_c0_g1_i1.p1 TRINITY_DN34803_c0_g1~~TRINITY_DN34803_c0_g1_i1.p1  ORF type:complete len:127 (+),score=29.47 TRINITY_DN34803_c0_g1_i1:94-474(+)